MGVPLFKLGLRGHLNCPMIRHSEEGSSFGNRLKADKEGLWYCYTKLIMKVKKLEKTVKTSQARRRAKIMVSDDDMASEDSSKQGRMIEEIDQDAGVTLVTPTKVSSQEDQHEDQLGVLSAAKVLADATRVHTYSRRRRAVSTGSGGVSTASTKVSTAGMIQQVNIIIPSSSATKDKGKGKAIMTESKPEQTTTKLKQRQERAGYEAAIRLQEQLDEEESQRIVRDAEVAQRLQEEIDAAEKQRMAQKLQAEERDKYSKVDQARMLIDLINQRKRYFAAQKAEAKRNKPMTQAQQRTYMSNYIKHMGSHTMQQLKRYTFDELKELFETTMKHVSTFTSIETEDKERESKLVDGSSKIPRVEHDEEHDEESVKKQNLEENDAEKEELRACLDIVPRDEIAMNFESLATKYPIIDWKTHILTDDMMYYQIIRLDKSFKNYKIFSEMLDDFDRQDVVDLHRLVQERYETTSLEGYDLLLWGDLKTLFEPCEEDEVWRNQQGYNL
ncbi:hypothetical protein Tco_0499977 [Tanacetum coccineum]